MIKDLTVGKPAKVLFLFALPLLLSTVFQQLYNIADSMIAGRFVGEDALSAVGASYPITMIFMAIGLGANIGVSVVVSRLFGAKRMKDVKEAVNTAFISIAVLSILLTALGLLISKPLLRLLGTPDNIFGDSLAYLNIYIGGLISLFMYNVATGIFSALGDSKTPLIFLIGSSIGNIILDIILVVPIKLGVQGVAWATFIAQSIAAILAVTALALRIKKIETEQRSRIFSAKMLKSLSYLSIPSILQQSFISVGGIIIQGLINSYDSSSMIAGYSAAIKLNTFAIMTFTTLANGLSSYTAQNIGANNFIRVKQGYKAMCLMATAVVVPFVVFFAAFPNAALKLFIENPSELAMKTGRDFLIIVSPFYFSIAIKLVSDAILRGSGKMFPFMISTFADLFLRIVLAYVFNEFWGSVGIWISWPVGWVASTIMTVAFCLSGVWKKQGKRKSSDTALEQ